MDETYLGYVIEPSIECQGPPKQLNQVEEVLLYGDVCLNFYSKNELQCVFPEGEFHLSAGIEFKHFQTFRKLHSEICDSFFLKHKSAGGGPWPPT